MSSTATRPGAAAADWTAATAPGALPLLGHLVPLRRRPLEFLTGLPRHGDVVELRMGRRTVHMVCHPELVGQVLKDPRTFDRGGPFYEKTKLLMGNSLGNCPYADHRRQRLLVQPSFRRERIATYPQVMREEMAAETAGWRPGGTIEANDRMHAVTARIGARVLLSTEIGTDHVDRILRCLPIVLKGMYKRMVAPVGLVYRVPGPESRRFEGALADLRELIDSIIRNYRGADQDHGDLLSGLLGARDEDGRGLSDQEIHDQVMNFLTASTETTATALAWALQLLGRHPEYERRLQEEADAFAASGGADAHGRDGLDYTRQVVNEVLRLYPPGWLVTRVVTADTELGGVRLPVGSVVFYSSYALHRNGELFPDPERFDPDRWSPERVGDVPRGAMIPFGAGSRKCIGDDFAMMETTLALATIAARWRLRPTSDTPVHPKPRALVGMGELPMVTELR
ncbi:cytochrome P450 [Kitasatospora sp. NPDC058201]|uniref:cytochrome P450 n=1 Tax=Streptomycetaceae TaxID=2062 RepID=UPI002E7AA647|nr:cytochrome P450 [Streptomyces sp. BE303]MED7953458.1 cytochrome P450 [Streptomyces sp. BE303]